MRILFLNPFLFINSAIFEAKLWNYTGYNLDFEPTGNLITYEDGINYCEFLKLFQLKLYENQLNLHVDLASWSKIWNFTCFNNVIHENTILFSMDTYTTNFTLFQRGLIKMINSFQNQSVGEEEEEKGKEEEENLFELEFNNFDMKWKNHLDLNENENNSEKQLELIEANSRIGIGLECDLNLSLEGLVKRIQLITEFNISHIGIWQMPVPDEWWPILTQWANGNKKIQLDNQNLVSQF